MTAGLLVRQSV